MNWEAERKHRIRQVQLKKSLDIHDKHSLIKAINSFENFGDDAEKYLKMLNIPDSILYGYLKTLEKLGFQVQLAREADRYKWVLYLCAQQTWNILKDVFEHTKIICIKSTREPQVLKKVIEGNIFKEALNKFLKGESNDYITNFITEKNPDIKFVVLFKNGKDGIVIGFDKQKGKFKINGGATNIGQLDVFDNSITIKGRKINNKKNEFNDIFEHFDKNEKKELDLFDFDEEFRLENMFK